MKLIEFSMERWKAGDCEVFTREGKRVLHLQEWPEMADYKLIGMVEGLFAAETWRTEGGYSRLIGNHPRDLMLRLPEPKMVERWRLLSANFIHGGTYSSLEKAVAACREYKFLGLTIWHDTYDPATGKGTIERVEP